MRQRLTTPSASLQTEFPNDVSVLEKFTCAKETINSYRWSHFSRLLKALHYSIRASIRVSDTGLLCIQLMMPKGTGQTSGPVNRGGAAGGAGQAAGKSQKDSTTAVQGHGFLEFLVSCHAAAERNLAVSFRWLTSSFFVDLHLCRSHLST